MITAAEDVTIRRILRALPIMERVAGELEEAARIFYPAIQVADIFYMGWTSANLYWIRGGRISSQENSPEAGFKKTVAVHHHMLMGLQGPLDIKGFEGGARMNLQIASKMSKSIPETSTFARDDFEVIRRRVQGPYRPPRSADGNPILDYAKHIIFRKFDGLHIDRPSKYGGPVDYYSYEELERDCVGEMLHPAHLKRGVAEALDKPP